eukprot:g10718.t1
MARQLAVTAFEPHDEWGGDYDWTKQLAVNQARKCCQVNLEVSNRRIFVWGWGGGASPLASGGLWLYLGLVALNEGEGALGSDERFVRLLDYEGDLEAAGEGSEGRGGSTSRIVVERVVEAKFLMKGMFEEMDDGRNSAPPKHVLMKEDKSTTLYEPNLQSKAEEERLKAPFPLAVRPLIAALAVCYQNHFLPAYAEWDFSGALHPEWRPTFPDWNCNGDLGWNAFYGELNNNGLLLRDADELYATPRITANVTTVPGDPEKTNVRVIDDAAVALLGEVLEAFWPLFSHRFSEGMEQCRFGMIAYQLKILTAIEHATAQLRETVLSAPSSDDGDASRYEDERRWADQAYYLFQSEVVAKADKNRRDAILESWTQGLPLMSSGHLKIELLLGTRWPVLELLGALERFAPMDGDMGMVGASTTSDGDHDSCPVAYVLDWPALRRDMMSTIFPCDLESHSQGMMSESKTDPKNSPTLIEDGDKCSDTFLPVAAKKASVCAEIIGDHYTTTSRPYTRSGSEEIESDERDAERWGLLHHELVEEDRIMDADKLGFLFSRGVFGRGFEMAEAICRPGTMLLDVYK